MQNREATCMSYETQERRHLFPSVCRLCVKRRPEFPLSIVCDSQFAAEVFGSFSPDEIVPFFWGYELHAWCVFSPSAQGAKTQWLGVSQETRHVQARRYLAGEGWKGGKARGWG